MIRFTRYILPVIAVGLLALAVSHVVRTGADPVEPSRPLAPPPSAPFEFSVAGAGLVEARTENIAVGSPIPGVVEEVFVEVGQQVAAQAALFRLDDRDLLAQLDVREAALQAAQAQLERLRNMPRPEQVPVAQAAVREAQARADDRARQLKRFQTLRQRGAATQEDLDTAQAALDVAQAELARMKAELDLLEAGTWKYELASAEVAVRQARAESDATRTLLERLVITAPVAGEVLQVNVRAGEFVGAPPSQPLVMLGDTEQLHVRADIDEADIPRFEPGAPAVAMPKGHPDLKYDLDFVRVEPYVIPKKSLTGENTERIDTRVLQVIYAVRRAEPRLYVGQQMDIFIQASRPPGK